MRLFIVRHGETDYNRQRRMQGYQEIPINDHGIAQATHLATRLREEAIDRIVSSDLRRTVMTGCIIASHTGAPMTYDAGFRERNPGALTESSYDDEPRFFTDADFVPPGGEGTVAFRQRVRDAFERLVSGSTQPGERVVVVTHGLVCNAFVSEFFGDVPGEGVGSHNTSMTVVWYDGESWTLERMGCVAHLPRTTPAPMTGAGGLSPGA